MPPKSSSYTVSSDVFSQRIIDFLDESKKMIPGHYKRSPCFMCDLNLPNATWALLCSPNDYENHILTTLSSYLFCLSFSATHKAGNRLDIVLCQYPWFSAISVQNNCHISDHYPLMFNLYDNTGTPISNRLTTRYSFYSHDELVQFRETWASFTFVDYPSTATVDHFHDHLLFSISNVFKIKTKKKFQLSFYYSPHRVHPLNKKDYTTKVW